jgi:hypothetical protein
MAIEQIVLVLGFAIFEEREDKERQSIELLEVFY